MAAEFGWHHEVFERSRPKIRGRERFLFPPPRGEKEDCMQKVIDFINTNTYDIFIPLTALALLRLAMCWAQLKRTASIREKKGIYHAVRDHYAEIGAWFGILPFCLLGLVLPKLWFVWLPLAVAGGILAGRAGRKKGVEMDGIYREVALELKQEAEAEAAREAAAHTLESGTETRSKAEDTDNTEDKGETKNG